MNNFFTNEKNILNMIKFGAITIIMFFSFFVITILIKHQKENLNSDIKNIEDSYISQNRVKVENLVNNIHNFIETERKFEQERLNKELKEQVYQAYEIANSIYNETKNDPNFSKEKTIKLIKESIRNIRFNDNIGYMFIYKMDGESILNAQFPEVEGSNHWEYRDSKGTSLLQEMNKILTQNDETYYDWYWKKTKDDQTQYKKIGFFKKFEPLDLFIGTGDYIDEFEKDLKEKILFKINSMKIKKPDHIFVYTLDGLCLANPKKELIGTNRINVRNEKGEYTLKDTLKYAYEKKEGFIEYNSTVMLNETLTSNKKISFIKLFEDWNWVIGSGFYLEELHKNIEKRKQDLITHFSNTIKEIVVFSLIIVTSMIILSLYLSKIVFQIFQEYREKINFEAKNSLEKEKLMIQQSKMAIMGEMIANIDNSVKYLSETIDDFRNFFRPDKEKNLFQISDSINQTIKLVSSQFKNNNIQLIENIEDVRVFGYQNELSQVLINLLKNAKDELVKLDNSKRRLVFINTSKDSRNLLIEVKDSAGGIPEEIISKIFDAYFTTKKDAEGTGIGLYMSKQIIEGMQGNIEALNEEFEFENETYKGALFRVTIPL